MIFDHFDGMFVYVCVCVCVSVCVCGYSLVGGQVKGWVRLVWSNLTVVVVCVCVCVCACFWDLLGVICLFTHLKLTPNCILFTLNPRRLITTRHLYFIHHYPLSTPRPPTGTYASNPMSTFKSRACCLTFPIACMSLSRFVVRAVYWVLLVFLDSLRVFKCVCVFKYGGLLTKFGVILKKFTDFSSIYVRLRVPDHVILCRILLRGSPSVSLTPVRLRSVLSCVCIRQRIT